MAEQQQTIPQEPVVNQQPSKLPPMIEKYREKTGTEEWRSDIWDCFAGADNLCLKATFCPCFVHGKIVARTRDPTLTGYNRFNEDCMIYAGANVCCGLGWVLHFLKRMEVRESYSLKGDVLTDFLLGWCCHCCSLIQVEKEVIARSAGSEQGYVAPAGMVATPQ